MTTIYLGGPINGCTDEESHGWRDSFMASLPEHNFKDPMVRDYRGREDECVNEIVELDKDDIDHSDIFLAYCWQPSWGTAMEILHAWEGKSWRNDEISRVKMIIVVVPEGSRVSPWLRYHSDAVVGTLDEARALIMALDDLPVVVEPVVPLVSPIVGGGLSPNHHSVPTGG